MKPTELGRCEQSSRLSKTKGLGKKSKDGVMIRGTLANLGLAVLSSFLIGAGDTASDFSIGDGPKYGALGAIIFLAVWQITRGNPAEREKERETRLKEASVYTDTMKATSKEITECIKSLAITVSDGQRAIFDAVNEMRLFCSKNGKDKDGVIHPRGVKEAK